MGHFMKRVILSLIFVICIVSLFADNNDNIDLQPETLFHAAAKHELPIKKMTEYLNQAGAKIDLSLDRGKTLEELNITENMILKAKEKFAKNRLNFGLGITLVGMVVVFASLILIGFIISQLVHITKHEERKKNKIALAKNKVSTSIGSVSTIESGVSMNSIVAVVTAIHMHRLEAEESQKMLLTWQRTPVSMWRSSVKTMMPNKEYNYTKRSR